MRQRWLTYISILGMVMIPSSLWALDVEPVAWWTLNEDSGDVAADAVAGRDGTVYNGAEWIEGVWGNALDLDGSDDYVDLPIGDVIASLEDVTIAVWVDFSQEGSSWQRIWDFGSSTTVNWFLTPMNGDGVMRTAITVEGNTLEAQVTAAEILASDWHHVTVTIDSESLVMQLLLDGELVGESSTHVLPSDLGETTQNWLGRSQYASDAYFNGALDDLRIYDVCLSAAEVAEVMADDATSSGSSIEPAGWWMFNEDSGTLAADEVAGRDGTVYNGAEWIEGVWGNGLNFDGSDDYVELPIGEVIGSLEDATVAVWVDFSQEGDSWQRIWDFGSGSTVNWFLTPMNSGGQMRTAITVGGSSAESTVTAPTVLSTDWHHVAVTIDSESRVMQLWLDGEVVGQDSTHLLPSDLGVTTQNWLGRSQYSSDAYFNGALDDLKIYNRCLSASELANIMADESGSGAVLSPEPADGSDGVELDALLRWPEHQDALVYILFWGTSLDEVTAASFTSPGDVNCSGLVETNQYTLESLQRKRTYYWRVDAVVGGTVGMETGEVWSFTTTGSRIIDDFESYTNDMDANEAIFQTWIDGWGDPFNGAWVGYSESPFAERNIVFEGKQSMPLWYDNLDGFAWIDLSWEDYLAWLILMGYEGPDAIYSHAMRSFEPVMDWAADARYLVLYIRGDETNTGGDLYLTVNDAVVVHPDPNALVTPLWQQWIIDFNEIDTDLSQVESMGLGVVGLDYGVMYVDSIGLYDVLPGSIEPQDPGTEGLALWYDMDGDLLDQSGNQLDGVTSGNPGFVAGLAGQALSFDGSDDHVTMPIGELVAQTEDMTLTMWVNFSGTGGSWQRIFDLGSGESINMFLTPSNSSGLMRFAMRTASVGEQQMTAEEALPTGWHHVTVIVRGSAGTMALYLDGNLVAEGTTELAPMDLGVTTQNWLGRSQYSADSYFGGTLDEFRIYTKALTELEIQYLALGNL